MSGPAVAADAGKQTRPDIILIEPHAMLLLWRQFRGAFVAAFEDNCFSIAKGAAYSFLLSVFPVLTALTSLLIQVKAQSVVHVIATFLGQVVPPGTEEIVLSRLRERGAKPISLPVAALLLSLWAGSGAMMSLMEGFQAAYRIPTGRSFLKQRAMGILLVLIAAFPAVGASSLIIFGDRGEKAIIHWIGVTPEGHELSAPVEMLWRVARYVLAFCTTTFVTGLLYYFGPYHNNKQAATGAGRRFWRVWPGAFLATVLWLMATTGFAWYVGHRLASYNIFYGSIGAVIVLTLWLYLLACIALIGCEFNAERDRDDDLRRHSQTLSPETP
ncbi:MAG: YihY/virulence factor BrkB family protein [Acidobacteriaceae bacterium]|nr:YihY/virulence factor BrkB family protein [Acidobacteriaceae bacterium]